MEYSLVQDSVVRGHVKNIIDNNLSHSTWTGEELLGAKMGQGEKLPPLLAINMYVAALFVIIKLLKHIDTVSE